MINDKERLIEIISDVLDVDLSNDDLSKPMDEIGINSINFIKLVVKCEALLDFEIEDDMLLISKFENLNDFIDYMTRGFLDEKE